MTKALTKLEVIDTIYHCLLGRHLNPTERASCEQTDMSITGNVAALVNSVIKSQEFFVRHRESLFHQLIPKSIIVTARTPLGQELIVDLHQLHLGFAMAAGHFEPNEVSIIKNIVKRDMFVVDIGANIGFYTVMFASLVGDAGRVVAFEPVPDSRSKLTASVIRNRLEHIVEIETVALSDTIGQVRIVHAIDTVNIGGAHISTDPAEFDRAEIATHMVNTRRLDDYRFNRRIDFIKMDIEGAEGLVLRGADATLRRDMPVMLVEFNEQQLRKVSNTKSEILATQYRSIGYDLFRFAGNSRITAIADGTDQIAKLLTGNGIFNCLAIPRKDVDQFRHLIASA
jgi:FkbM family methyltransferase